MRERLPGFQANPCARGTWRAGPDLKQRRPEPIALVSMPALAQVKSEETPPRAQVLAALRARLLEGGLELPLLPQIASEVMALAGNPSAEAARLSALIHRDPALAGKVLRMANSAASAARMPVVSLQQAVARLGMVSVSELAFAASVQGGVFTVRGHEALLRGLWRHALASASYAREIARGRRNNVEGAYLCGLLHTVGKPLVLRFAVKCAEERALALSPADLGGLLEELHVPFGMVLGESWKLPRTALAAIAFHQEPARAPAFRTEAVVTALASALGTHALASAVRGGPEEDALRALPHAAELNLYPEDLDALFAAAEKVRAAVDSLTV